MSSRNSGYTPGWSTLRIAAAVAAVPVAIAVVAALIGVLGGWDSTDGGQVAVVRNGGPMDSKNIRQVIPQGSSLTWTGMWSNVHKYPATQRFYTITSDAKR